MKKVIFPAMLLVLAATGCSDDEKNTPNTRNLSGEWPVVVMPTDEHQPGVITQMPMKITQYLAEGGVWRVDVKSFTLPSGDNLSFTTPDIFASGEIDWSLRYISNFNAESGQVIRDYRAELINNYYYFSNTGGNAGGTPPMGTIVASMFRVGGEYTVTVIPHIAYYGGTTVTQYQIKSEEVESTFYEPLYYITLDLKNMTADLVIYNARFADLMPALAAVNLRGLKLETSHEHGYTISGKNVVPSVGVGSNEVEYPQYVFDEIEMHPTNSLYTSCEIEYTVANKYKGRFTGSYRVQEAK